jgi:hypothetical protein
LGPTNEEVTMSVRPESFVAAAIASVFASVSLAQTLPSNVPLPPNLQLIKPAENLPPKLKVFAGKWVGSWDGILDHVLIVEEISFPDRVVAIYAHATAPNWNIWKPGWFRPRANFAGETLELRPRNGAYITYTLTSDDELRGTYELSQIRSRVTMKRVRE